MLPLAVATAHPIFRPGAGHVPNSYGAMHFVGSVPTERMINLTGDPGLPAERSSQEGTRA
jgi:hypothetical protein